MMAKVLVFPGVDIDPPSRNKLVDDVSDLMLAEVVQVFDEQDYQDRSMETWLREIRDYYWRTEIKLYRRTFRENDLKRWRNYWRGQALDYVQSKRVR